MACVYPRKLQRLCHRWEDPCLTSHSEQGKAPEPSGPPTPLCAPQGRPACGQGAFQAGPSPPAPGLESAFADSAHECKGARVNPSTACSHLRPQIFSAPSRVFCYRSRKSHPALAAPPASTPGPRRPPPCRPSPLLPLTPRERSLVTLKKGCAFLNLQRNREKSQDYQANNILIQKCIKMAF